MRKLTIATVAAAMLSCGPHGPVVASAPKPLLAWECGFVGSRDETGVLDQDDTLYGEIDGGPQVIADLGSAFPYTIGTVPDLTHPPHKGSSGTLLCWLDTSGYDYTDDGYGFPGICGASASAIAGVVYLPPTPVQCPGPPGADLYLCAALVNLNGDPANDWVGLQPPGSNPSCFPLIDAR